MKKIFTLFVLCLISFTGIKAQEPIEVSEDSLQIGGGSIPAMSVRIPEVEYEKTLKSWIKILESGTKSKVVTENKQMSVFGAKVKTISDNPVNVYSTLLNEDDGVNLKVAFEEKKDEYVEKSSGEYPKANEFLFDFAKDQYVELVSEQVRSEENKLRDLERDLASMEREQEKLEKSTRSNKETINTEKDRLALLNTELESVSGTITEDSSQPAGMGASEIKEDYVKDLDKKREKTQKEIESAEKKVNKAEKEIEDAEREIPKTVEEQEKLRSLVSEQEAVVKKYTAKLNTIKEYK